MVAKHIELLVKRYGKTPCRSRKPRAPVKRIDDLADLRISQACQLRRLRQLFRCGPVTCDGGGVLAVEGVGAGVGGETDVPPASPVMPGQFTD